MSSYIPVRLQRQVREIFADCCAYYRTAKALIIAIFEFEHIVPISAGGETVLENPCFACPTCNRYKATRQTAVDPTTGRVVSLFHPQLQTWKDHFAWNKDATEIIGLTSVGRATISALKMNRSQLTRVHQMWVKLGVHPPVER